MSILRLLFGFVLDLLKALFGLKEPQEHEVINEENSLPAPADDQLLDELGVRHPGAGGKD